MKSKVSKNSLRLSVSDFKCPYCNKAFKRETTLFSHSCERKKRFLSKDEPSTRIAFGAFVKFYEIHFRSKSVPTFEKFINSNLYKDFHKFGEYIVAIDALSPSEYIDYMIRSSVPINLWCKDSEYEKYVTNLVMKETPNRALERTYLFMQKWAAKEGVETKNFFRNVPLASAAMWIKSGRISPWVILNCESGRALLQEFSDEQVSMISGALNNRLWKGKFSRHPAEVNDIRDALEAEGL